VTDVNVGDATVPMVTVPVPVVTDRLLPAARLTLTSFFTASANTNVFGVRLVTAMSVDVILFALMLDMFA
jgi:hypothetical protein